MNNRYIKARTFARKRHEGQRYGDYPYYIHLDAVAKLASPFGTDAMIVAQFHDILEDTKTTRQEIETDYGKIISRAVCYMTDEVVSGRDARKAVTHQRFQQIDQLEESGRLALIVKVCDRLANVRAARRNQPKKFAQYKKEHDGFKQATYRRGLCEALWWELDMLIERM
ncbi:Bifunctional (p)ppGpp synthase/hydrolase RelA [Vibrio stylophorae]|uniref:Bifunctional (P)ppGpp synthase/hydrolase RelA n=1 Tax=Vibrio stylophorae TaxID=659351 RepID=A0ABM8ZXS4_9VIBR|nr:HD domain-containing protein [Vibrio stylophorae]CAH0535438.1 Bifunctional (p)ppGpp synthase/hydrolase RelA [Vibrio stylophorae]